MIVSTANRQVRRVCALRTKAKERRQEGVFVAEGLRFLKECPTQDIEMLYMTPAFKEDQNKSAYFKDLPCELVSETVMSAMADTKTPQGILATVRCKNHSPQELIRGGDGGAGAPFYLVLETLQDPGNLGTIFRSAEAAGVRAIFMDGCTADPYSPKVIRSTMGSILRVPFAVCEDFPAVLKALKAAGIVLYATAPSGAADYSTLSYLGPVAILIGNEGNGLSAQTLEMADRRVRIPMLGQVESLNAACAASVLLFEAARQKRAAANTQTLT